MSEPRFWTSGSLPTEAELRDFLHSHGVSTAGGESIEQIIEEYRSSILSTSDSYIWSQDQINEWVNNKVGDAKAVQTDPGGTGVPGSGPSMTDEIIAQRAQDDAKLKAHSGELADQRSQVLHTQAQSYYDQTSRVQDAGPGDGATMAESIALGFQVDENGEPVLDQNGSPVPVNPATLWDQIKGMSFNMGSLSPPRTVGVARNEPLIGRENPAGYRQVNQFRPAQVMAMLTAMDPDYLSQLQHKMWEAGFFTAANGKDTLPSWGQPDVATRRAFNEMFITASTNPDEAIDKMLARMASERITRQAAPDSGPGAGPQQLPSFTPEVTSEATLNQTIDQIAQHLRGEFASPKEKADLVKRLQAKETETQRTQYEHSLADAQAKYEATGSTSGEANAGNQEIDRFMAAIAGKESGGNYQADNPDTHAYGKFQIMPENWGPWSERAGLGPNAPRTPGNQTIVARRIMLDYYKQFGNWRDVAVAWYSGPGRVAQLRDSSKPQGRYPSIAAYANEVMSRFAGSGNVANGQLAVGNVYAPTERFDPAAEAEAALKAQDPAGWQAHEYGNQAIQFFQLLHGVAA